MALHGNRPSIVHEASVAVLSAYTYYEVIGGTGGGTATINGTAMAIAEGTDVSLVVRTISGVGGNVYLGGDPINVSQGTTIIGGSFTGSQ